MPSPQQLRYGATTDLPPRRLLRAGPLTLVYEGGDLRSITLGDREVLQRVYVAVRDRNWGTVPITLSDERIAAGDDSFAISYTATHQQGPIVFTWRGQISGDATGTISFTMDGVARSTFLRNRIGFCVLHPPEAAGARCLVETASGTLTGELPRLIAPNNPFLDMQAISHEVAPEVWADLRFTGDLFEMEDQRNWTDASFKTFCTPLRLPYPVEIVAGSEVRQSVVITLRGSLSSLSPEENAAKGITLTRTTTNAVQLPPIGLGSASHGQPLDEREIKRLRELHLAHLRADLPLDDPALPHLLERATNEARALGVGLEAALFLADDAPNELRRLRQLLDQISPPVAAWLVFRRGELVTDSRWVAQARAVLGDYTAGAPFVGGTNVYFTELNRNRPDLAPLDGMSYSVNPQVHAFDNASLMETPPAIAATVASARAFCGDLPIRISPVTLRPRFNPVATGPEPTPGPNELPHEVDARQMSLFAACWTLAALKQIALSGVASVTLYETTGWRGVMELAAGAPQPDLFPSLPGGVFPVYHLLADIGPFAGGRLAPLATNAPLAADGFTIEREGRTRTLVANLTNEMQAVTLQMPDGEVLVRMLDETNAERAMIDPKSFRAEGGAVHTISGGTLPLQLLPYALARIDR